MNQTEMSVIEVGVVRIREGGPWHEAAMKKGLLPKPPPPTPKSIEGRTWWVVARYDWYRRAQRGEWGRPQMFFTKENAENYVKHFGGHYGYRWVMFEFEAPMQEEKK